MQLADSTSLNIEGHLKIWSPLTGSVFLQKRNAIHAENLSAVLAESLANKTSYINELHFGNGGTVIDSVGNITYRSTNTTNLSADLHQSLYYKIISQDDNLNKMEVTHISDTNYSDIIVTATLETNEPSTSSNLLNTSNEFVFDEIGLKSKSDTEGAGKLLTHVIFNPITKTLTNQVQVVYTIRFRIGT